MLIIATAFVINANAQEDYQVNANKKSYAPSHPKTIWNFDYSMGFAVGDFRDFIDEASFRGFNFDGRSMINANFSVGGGIGWNVFNKSYSRSTYEFNGGALTGKKWDYFFQMPLYINAHYYFTHSGPVQPRIGIATGGYYTEYEVQMGSFAVVDKQWKFGFTPELEIYVPFSNSFGISVSGKYNYIFYNDNNINGLQNFSLDIGFTFAP